MFAAQLRECIAVGCGLRGGASVARLSYAEGGARVVLTGDADFEDALLAAAAAPDAKVIRTPLSIFHSRFSIQNILSGV
jgi:hypothetical protein